MRHLGDITKIHNPEAVDIITGGSPCQDLSIAGKRAGLAGAKPVWASEIEEFPIAVTKIHFPEE